MPCSEYKGGQRRLCFATKGWKDWKGIKTEAIKFNGVGGQSPTIHLKELKGGKKNNGI